MKLRNMTGIYLSCNGQMLLLYRQGGRVVSNQWIEPATFTNPSLRLAVTE